MTSGRPPTIDETLPIAAAGLPQRDRFSIFLYLGGLSILLAFADPAGGLIGIPISFLLKNKLHFDAHELATFRLITGIPLYLSFLFGLARDTWNPFGMRDRGFIALFGGVSVALYVAFSYVPVTGASLMLAMICLTSSFLFIGAALNGLASALGQQHEMTGQISAAYNIFGALPGIAALLLGGGLSEYLESYGVEQATRALFIGGAALASLLTAYAVLKPRSVFENIRAERAEAGRPLQNFKRLIKHRPIYPALGIWLLWNFAPGSTTPLQYYLQNTLGAGDSAWGLWNAIFAASFIPTFLIFGYLCQRVPLKTLLWVGSVIAVPQFVPLLFVHTTTGALIAAAPIGLMGGMATAAFFDLIIRSCPPGLQGTTMMLSGALYFVASRFGDVLGTRLYEYFGGFGVCVAMITFVYALILPTLLLVPQDLIATPDRTT